MREGKLYAMLTFPLILMGCVGWYSHEVGFTHTENAVVFGAIVSLVYVMWCYCLLNEDY